MSLTDAQRAAYRFLLQHAADGREFTSADIESVAGWKANSFNTYRTKHLTSYVRTTGRRRYVVDRLFQRLTEEDYAEIVGQSRKTVARFMRTVVHATVRYEFLLPLTNERKLRAALDELFYREPLERRAKEIGREALSKIVAPQAGESDRAYFSRVAEHVASLLGGYSIGHVNGRFRVGGLLTYGEAADVLSKRGRYLVDETTAVVRFILTIPESFVIHGPVFDVSADADHSRDFSSYIGTARRLFIAFFVESVIIGIHGEDEIWFLESGPRGERLYILERDDRKRTTRRKRFPEQLAFPSIGDSVDVWLRANGYADVAERIEKIVANWKVNGVKTRRNWWDILAGDKVGKEREVAGERFPIIASIRERQGYPPIKDALSQPDERPPPPK